MLPRSSSPCMAPLAGIGDDRPLPPQATSIRAAPAKNTNNNWLAKVPLTTVFLLVTHVRVPWAHSYVIDTESCRACIQVSQRVPMSREAQCGVESEVEKSLSRGFGICFWSRQNRWRRTTQSLSGSEAY